MAKSSIKVTGLAGAITQELTLYHDEVIKRVDRIGEASIKQLASVTRQTAPTGKRGEFARSISSKRIVKRATGSTYVWYVKPPNHRLTHLLVNGHAAKDGGRVPGNPFLQNALDKILPEYENAVKEALKW